MPESTQPRVAKAIVIIVLVAAVLSALYYFKYVGDIEPNEGILKPNWYAEVHNGQWSTDIEKADQLAKDGQPAEALQILETVLPQITEQGQKSVVDLTIASITFFSIDKIKGVERYATIAATTQYPAISRAYAMLVVADHFDAVRDKNLLQPFFSDQEFADKDQSVLILALYQRIYDMHPFGLAAAKLAGAHIRKTRTGDTISDGDYAVVLRYIGDIDKNLPELETSPAFKRFIPVTLLIKAALFRIMEDVGRQVDQPIENRYSVEEIYLLAITRARILNIAPVEQFSVLYYADYMAKKGNKTKVMALLSESLSSVTLDKAVKGFLQSESSVQNSLPYLHTLQQKDADVRAAYTKLTETAFSTPQ